jgi:hypothetical protein
MSRKVLASFESDDGMLCVDIFMREDGTFGFEEFREEQDGGTRWQPLGRFAMLAFPSGEAALSAAQTQVQWLCKSEIWRW